MKRRQSTFSLPIERASQLRYLADVQKISVSTLLERFITQEPQRLGICNHVNGFIVDREDNLCVRGVGYTRGIKFGVHASFLLNMLPAEGRRLIEALASVIETGIADMMRP